MFDKLMSMSFFVVILVSQIVSVFGAVERQCRTDVRGQGVRIVNAIDTTFVVEQLLADLNDPVVLNILDLFFRAGRGDTCFIRVGQPIHVQNTELVYFPLILEWGQIIAFLGYDINTLELISFDGMNGMFAYNLNHLPSGSYMIFADPMFSFFAVNETENIMIQPARGGIDSDFSHNFQHDFMREAGRMRSFGWDTDIEFNVRYRGCK